MALSGEAGSRRWHLPVRLELKTNGFAVMHATWLVLGAGGGTTGGQTSDADMGTMISACGMATLQSGLTRRLVVTDELASGPL